MNFKRNLDNLNKFKLSLKNNEKKEIKEIISIIKWRKKLQDKIKTKSKLINLKEVEDWFFDKIRIYIIKVNNFLK